MAYEDNLTQALLYMTTKGENVALIDADIVAFKFSVLNEDTFDWGDDCVTHLSDVPRALAEAKLFVKYIAEACGGYPVLCFTGDDNFRKREYPDYKSNRKSHDKPDMLSELKDEMAKHFYSVKHDELEADDLLGIFQTALATNRSMIATIDKDLDQIEGWHHNWNKRLTYHTTAEEGRRFFWRQVLTGDNVDGYKGCLLVGPKGADTLLGDLHSDADCFPLVYDAYKERELKRKEGQDHPTHDLAYLISQARCALMLTEGDFDWKTNKPIMWSPPNDDS